MDLKDKTNEELESELKRLGTGVGLLTRLLLVLLIVCVYGLIYSNESGIYSSLIVVPIALGATIPYSKKKMKKIKAELNSRK